MDVKKSQIDIEETESATTKERAAVFIKETFFGALYALSGYFLGTLTLPFGAAPFGIALLAASDRKVFYILAGLIISAWQSENRLLLIAVFSSVVLLRMLVRFVIDPPWKKENAKASGEKTFAEIYPYLFAEHISLRMASSAVGAFAVGLYRLIEGGLMFYDLYGTIISVVGAPLSVLLISGFFSKTKNKYRRLLAFVAISFGIAFAIGPTKLYGISLAMAFCLFVTLYLTKKEGAVLGILSGSVLGLAISVESVPIFAFAALVYSLLSPISLTLAAGGALSVTIAWGVYSEGLSILNGTASALVSSILVFSVCDKLFISVKEKKKKKSNEEKVEVSEAIIRTDTLEMIASADSEQQQLKDINELLTSVKESFFSMSETLYAFIEKAQTPSASDMKQICDTAFDRACTSCENRRICWSEKYRETSDALVCLSSSLVKNGSVKMDSVEDDLLSVCTRMPDILSEINHNAYLHMRQILEGDRTEVFALDYKAMADFLESTVCDNSEEYEIDTDLSEKLSKRLGKINSVIGVSVYGKRQRKISVFCKDRQSFEKDNKKISSLIAKETPFSIGVGVLDENEAIIRFAETESISAVFAERNLRALGEDKYCGDTSGIFRVVGGKLYSFISDGMGSGREASISSGLCAIFLRKFLTARLPVECVLSLLNGFLRNRGSGSLHECSATIDLMELDLIRRKASFYKSGAAPTYVFRNNSLFKICSHTVPVGIIKDPDIRRIDMDISAGDLVVMVSDGVTDGKEECPWLFDLLRSQGETAAPDRLVDLIVKYAKSEGASDDISVLVIKVNKMR